MTRPLTNLRKLHEAATPAPWFPKTRFAFAEAFAIGPKHIDIHSPLIDPPPNPQAEADAQLIAEMRNLLPSLLDALEEAKSILERVNKDADYQGSDAMFWLEKHAHLFEDQGK